MKKLIFFGVLGLFILASCNSTVTHTHNEHDHEAEGHNHATEDHDHSAHGDESGERHSHETAGSHLETAEAHSDEIILPKVKAEAAGVKASIIEPAPFQQVIKTSGQVLAAQGDESVAVATVAGVVSFRGKVTEGMSVGNGTPLVTISSNNIADGDPVQRARIAYEVSKKEYERMKALVKNKIVSDKEFAQAEQNLENTKAAAEKQKKKLEVLQKETKAAKAAALTVQDIEAMGKKNALTGNVSLTPQECDTLKKYAVNGIAVKADNRRLKEKLASAEKTASIWKQRYEALNEKYQALKKKAQPYLDALEIASERVWAFLSAILARGKEQQEHTQPAHSRKQNIEI